MDVDPSKIGVHGEAPSDPSLLHAAHASQGVLTPDELDSPQNCVAPEPHQVPLRVRLAVLAVVFVPVLGLAGAIVLLWGAEFYWQYLFLFGLMYALTFIGIGVGYHRLFTHRSFETGPAVRAILAILGSMAVEGGVLRWVAMHRQHHQHTDAPGDPHSPHIGSAVHGGRSDHHHDDDHEMTLGGVLRGAYHAHIGWFFDPDPPDFMRLVPDLSRDPVVRFVDKTFVFWAVLSFIIPAVVGGLIANSWWGVLQGALWGGLVRVLAVHHVTWSVNSVCHLWGLRPFETGDHSRDNPILGFLAFGEGWHNTHHAFPASARHGMSWWKLDIAYFVIRGLQLLHLARSVRLPTAERLNAKRRASAG